MRRFAAVFCCYFLAFLNADSATFSLNQLETFYTEFMCEEKSTLSQVDLSSSCVPGGGVKPLPTPPPPVPVPNPPAPPAPTTSGLLPFVFVNNSGVPDSQVYILIQGRVPIGGPQVFIDFGPGVSATGEGTLHTVSSGENGSTYTKPLTDFPTTGPNTYHLYIPQTDSGLVFVSLNSALNIPVHAGAKIADPAFDNPNDPYNNFNILWDQVEFAYVSTSPNISVDATAVSFFSIPMAIYLSTADGGSASNCGLTQTRNSVMSYLEQVFATVPPTPENSQWSNLVLKNGSTILRVLSPGKAIAGGYFDQNYLDNFSSYYYSYLYDIWYGATAFYKTNTLSIKIPGGKVYSGNASGNSLILTSGSDSVTLGPVALGPPYASSASFSIFSANKDFFSATTNTSDAIQVCKAFEEAVIAGIVPTTSLIDASTLTTLSSFRPYYQINSNLTGLGKVTGPWYDLYSAGLHACGLIYTFAFDEPLWPEVLLGSSTLQPTTYIGITIGKVD